MKIVTHFSLSFTVILIPALLYAGSHAEDNLDEFKEKHGVFLDRERFSCADAGREQPPAPSSEIEVFSTWKLVSPSTGIEDLSFVDRSVVSEDNSAKTIGKHNEFQEDKAGEAHGETAGVASKQDTIARGRNSSKHDFDFLIAETAHWFDCHAMCKATIEAMVSCPTFAANTRIFPPTIGKPDEDCAWWEGMLFLNAAQLMEKVTYAKFSEYLLPVGKGGAENVPELQRPPITSGRPQAVELLRHRTRF